MSGSTIIDALVPTAVHGDRHDLDVTSVRPRVAPRHPPRGAARPPSDPEAGPRRPATTVVLAHGELLHRRSLAVLLPLGGDLAVVAEAADGSGAVAATLAHRPDVLILHLDMQGTDGLDAVAEIRRRLPEQVILTLTRHGSPGVLRTALKLGVRGFATTGIEPSQLASVVATLRGGRRWIDQDVSASALADDCPLTDREIEVLRVTGEGYAVSEIAQRMHLAQGTVRNYLSSAIQKTHTRTRHAAARHAREHGWV